MMDYERLQKALQTYFPSETVTYKVITNKMYIDCNKIFSITLDFAKERCVMIERIEVCGYKGIYKNELEEVSATEKYVFHSIVSSLIRSKKALYIKRIYCKLRIFRDYMKDMYPKYMANDELNKGNSIKIDTLLNLESSKFAYFDTIGKIGSIKTVIRYGVEFYPIWYIGKFTNKFNYLDIIKDFNPYLQNINQIKFVADNFLSEEDRKIVYTNILSSIDMDTRTVTDIINRVFDGKMSATIFKHTLSFKKFNLAIAELYKIHELNIWEYIANMEGLDEAYIDTYYSYFKPYFRDIFKNPDLSLEFLESHRRDIYRSGSFPVVLLLNKNINRNYLLKYKRKFKNAIIHRIALLNYGDEYLFKKYRRHLKWELLEECYVGNEDVSINAIIDNAGKYLTLDQAVRLKDIHNTYINTMFVTK